MVLHREGGGATSPTKKEYADRLSLLHRPEECAILQQPSGVEVRPIFDKKQIAIGKWQLAVFGTGFWIVRLPVCLTPASQKRTCRGPRAPSRSR